MKFLYFLLKQIFSNIDNFFKISPAGSNPKKFYSCWRTNYLNTKISILDEKILVLQKKIDEDYAYTDRPGPGKHWAKKQRILANEEIARHKQSKELLIKLRKRS